MSRASARPKSFATPSQGGAGPGAYDDGKRWNSNVKPHTIGQRRTPKPKDRAPAPGQYNPEKAETITRPKTAQLTFDKSPARGRKNNDGDSNVGPGAYDDGKRWNSNVKPMTIRKKPKDRRRDQVPDAG